MTRRRLIGVFGAGDCDVSVATVARDVGRLLAARGATVLTGGLGGVMAEVSRGARSAGGLVIGVVPGADPDRANEHVDVVIASGVGDARNAILANSGDAFLAIAGGYGTLSEIAFALKRGKRVVRLGRGTLAMDAPIDDPNLLRAESPAEAVERVLEG